MKTIFDLLETYLMVLIHPFRIHQQFRYQVALPGQENHFFAPLKLSEALLGKEYPIQTLDGDIIVTIPEGVAIDEILRVRGKGVPTSKSKRGDLLIKLNIKLPNKLSRKSRELVEELQKEGV